MNSWPIVTLGEVVIPAVRGEAPRAGTIYRQIGVKLWGEGAYEREPMDGSATRYRQLFRAESGDIIVNKIWARNGSVAVVPPALAGCYGSGEFPMFATQADRLDPRWVHWLTKTPSFWEQCDEKSRGTSGQNRIRPEQLLRVEIPLPTIEEQRRIVARIEELTRYIHDASALRQLVRVETGALGSASGNAIFRAANEQFGSRPLARLTIRITKGESPAWQGFTYQDSGPLFIRSENVLWGTIDHRSATHIPEAFHQKLSRSQLRQGDVLLNLVGASIGRCCVVPDTLGPANVNQAVAVITPETGELSPEFLLHFLLSPLAQDTIHGGKVETARPNISLGDIRALGIPTPPLPEQHRIVAELGAFQLKVDELKRLQDETAAELDALLPSILDRAFKGGL